MKSFKHARLAVAVAVAACGAMGGMVASQRTGAAMAKNAQAFLDSLNPEQREKAADPLDSADRTHWNFIPTNQFPRQGLPLKEMTEPQRKLALRAAADRPQPAGLHHHDDDHERPRGDPAGHRGRGARRQAGRRSRDDPRSRAVLLHDLRHAGSEGAAGAGASKATTSRCTSPSPTAAPWSPRRRSGAPTRRKCAKGRRRACARSTRSRTPAARW